MQKKKGENADLKPSEVPREMKQKVKKDIEK